MPELPLEPAEFLSLAAAQRIENLVSNQFTRVTHTDVRPPRRHHSACVSEPSAERGKRSRDATLGGENVFTA